MIRVRVMSATGLAPVTVLALTGDLAALRLHDTRRGIVAWPQAGRVRRVLLCSEAGDVLDEALAVGTHAGGELHLHGGTSVRDGVMDWLGRSGCMLESLEHGTAPTSWRHVRAKLSARCGPMARLCAEVTAALEAECIDPDLRARIAAALDWAPFAQALRRPPVVRLVGRPNAGKSTLFNALLGSERALASPEPGTTRDLVGASWQLLGVPVCLEDTAGGLPETTDADLVVEVLDGATAVSTCRNALRVHGRADLHARLPHATRVSSRTGEGLERLRGRIAGRLGLPADLQRDLLAPVETAHLALLTAAGDFASQQPKGCRAPTGHRPAARR